MTARKKPKATPGGVADLSEEEWRKCFAVEMWSATTFDPASIEAFLDDPRVPADIREHLIETREEAYGAYRQDQFELAVARFETLHARCLFYGQNLAAAPEVRHANKFKAGRKEGTVGPVRAFVRKYLAKHPKAYPAEVWSAIKLKPPKDVKVIDPFKRSERRIEWDQGPTSYRHFQNIVSEEKGQITK